MGYFPSMKTIIGILAAVAIAISSSSAGKTEAVAAHKLSEFKLGKLIAGPQVDLANTGGKAVMIEEWGIHCGTCMALLPEVEKLARTHKQKLIVVGAHSQDATDAEVQDVVKKHKLSYTITAGVNGPIRVETLPHAYVFDRTGALVFHGSPLDKDYEAALRKAMRDPRVAR